MFTRFAICAYALTAALSGLAAGRAPLVTNAVDAAALEARDFATSRPFELTGGVILRHGSTALFEDPTGRIRLWAPHGKAKAGDKVHVTGRTRITGDQRNCLYVERFDVIGNWQVPQPVDAPLADIARGRHDLKIVRAKGRVTDVFVDDIDPWCVHLILSDGGDMLPVLIPGDKESAERLMDAEVNVRGACFPNNGSWRTFCGPEIEIESLSDIEVVVPPSTNAFDAPPLGRIHPVNPTVIAAMGRRRVVGTVSAVWHGDHMLVRTDDGMSVIAKLAHGEATPPCGAHVRAVGFPSTDLFLVVISAARWRPEPGAPKKAMKPMELNSNQLFSDSHGRPQLQARFYGKIVRLRGSVRSLPTKGDPEGRMMLDCAGHILPVDATSCQDALDRLALNCVVNVTGACLLDTDSWHSGAPLPRVRGLSLVLRTADDIDVVSRPSWWTPTRLLAVILALFAALAASLVWIRMLNRIVERRSRELVKAQTARIRADMRTRERTQLAAELHDALSQNLAALACQIAAGRSALGTSTEAAAKQFETAERMLMSSRTELRRCLWDLRGEALEAKSITEALKTVLSAVAGKCEVSVHFNVPRSHVSDSDVHAILCIVRELVSNAVRHGHASHVQIDGERRGDVISFSVQDDGCGFDPASRPGLAEGHFGLQGVKERIARLGGTFTIESSSGRGTTIAAKLKVAESQSVPQNPLSS